MLPRTLSQVGKVGKTQASLRMIADFSCLSTTFSLPVPTIALGVEAAYVCTLHNMARFSLCVILFVRQCWGAAGPSAHLFAPQHMFCAFVLASGCKIDAWSAGASDDAVICFLSPSWSPSWPLPPGDFYWVITAGQQHSQWSLNRPLRAISSAR